MWIWFVIEDEYHYNYSKATYRTDYIYHGSWCISNISHVLSLIYLNTRWKVQVHLTYFGTWPCSNKSYTISSLTVSVVIIMWIYSHLTLIAVTILSRSVGTAFRFHKVEEASVAHGPDLVNGVLELVVSGFTCKYQ